MKRLCEDGGDHLTDARQNPNDAASALAGREVAFVLEVPAHLLLRLILRRPRGKLIISTLINNLTQEI